MKYIVYKAMAHNIFTQDPVRVVVYNPMNNTNMRTFIFLGDVPRGVSNACQNYKTNPNDKLLKEFYGPDYKSKLGLDVTDYSRAWIYTPDIINVIEKTGRGEDPVADYERESVHVTYASTNATPAHTRIYGAAIDEIDDSDIAELLSETPRKHINVEVDLKTAFKSGVEYVTDVHVYPEDKFSELKDKIHLATNIPAYRQHMFYIARSRLQTVYKIHAEGIYNIDIRRLLMFKDNIYGIPIDKTLYDMRENVRVEAMDMFNVLSDLLVEHTIYVVDLAQFTQQLQLHDMLRDTYQFELFYYGFIIKYWPQLTPECFHDYVISESELQYKYPDLAKNKSSLAATYRAEREIIDYNYKNLTKAISNSGATIAVTQMIATVPSTRVMLNIRNLFDKLRVTRCVPEIHAFVEHNNKRYLLRKRHIQNGSGIQFPSGALMKTGITLAISLRKSDQESFHAKKAISTMENEQSRYLFLNIWPNGRYYVRTVWNEEDELGFEDIIKIMKRFTDPIIHGINNLGRYAFIAGSEIQLLSKHNVRYQSLNICIFWKKVMLENTFKIVRSMWDNYMRARITGQRNVQQFDKYEFLFRKGMREFDTGAIERIVTASNNIILSNYYSHLSNNTIKQKWDQNYDGRIVRMSHRTTDVRFEVIDIREKEFLIFYNYIMCFIYRASNDERVKESFGATRSYADVKKLRKLREQDPELYNLKKYGSKKVYSIICQNQRQPLIYTQDEMKGLPAAELNKLTQYWNFTLNKPAYYGCPNKKYPHLSFMVGAHPKHYCLPCCNKKPQTGDESRKTKVNAICLKSHKYIDSHRDGVSRHVMNYGKDIDMSRLSKLPQTSLKNLLYGTIGDPTMNYYLFGVPQHVPGVENIGLLYSVAEAMNMPMEDLVKKVIYALKQPESALLFNTLINGTLSEYFNSNEELISTLKDLFIDAKLFSKEIQRFKKWPELFTEIFHLLFKISIFVFLDNSGAGDNIELYMNDSLKNEIIYTLRLANSQLDPFDPGARSLSLVNTLMAEQQYIVIVKKQNKCYPVFVIDADRYFKSLEVEIRKFSYHDGIIQTLYNVVKYDTREDSMLINRDHDLALVAEFVVNMPEYNITKKFINRQNLCYAIIVAHTRGQIYIPVSYSVHVDDKIELDFNAFLRTDYSIHLNNLDIFCTDFNKFIREHHSVNSAQTILYSYNLIVMKEFITVSGKIIGCASDKFIFYITDYDEIIMPLREIKYDYTTINKAILTRAEPIVDNRTKLIGEALYTNYIYQLFVIEFVNFLDTERNVVIRSRLKSLINDTNFKKEVGEFRKDLRELLKLFPADFTLMQHQLVEFYYNYFNKPMLLSQIDATVYDFDRVTMNKLKLLGLEDLKVELRRISNSFAVEKNFDTTAIKFPNIYMHCAELIDVSGYCDNAKLMVNQSIDELVNILAADLQDDLKSKYLLNNMFMDIVVDYFRFTKWSTEVITIYKLTE